MRLAALLCCAACAYPQSDSWSPATEKEARQTIGSMRVQGQVGSSFDFRVTSTDRSYNYKLRATWITPRVQAAAAKWLGFAKGIPASDANEMLRIVGGRDAWIVLVELDPREGSGVIPREWVARFGPVGSGERQVIGKRVAAEGVWQTLISAFPRDYSYDVFLLEFPRIGLVAGGAEAELTVRIYNKQGHVRWKVPADVSAQNR